MTDHYDVIVVGAGSAGSVVTRRLVDAGRRVLLLEAGGQDTNPMIHDLVGMGALWHGPEDWDYYTVPQPHAAGRRLHLPRGKVLGGSHSLNADDLGAGGRRRTTTAGRPTAATGWGWNDVLPVFQAIENYDGGRGRDPRGRRTPRRRRATTRSSRSSSRSSTRRSRSASSTTRTTTAACSTASLRSRSPSATARV